MGFEYEDFIKDKPALRRYIIQNDCNYGRNTPVPNEFLNTLIDNEVIMSFQVFSVLFDLAEKTKRTNCEHTFILFATNMRGNKCVINEMFTSNTMVDPNYYSLNAKSIEYLNRKGEEVRNGEYPPKTTAVFIGHTHPARGKWYDNFSVGDLSAYSDGVWGNPVYVKREIESTAGCMLTSDGIMRMVFYNPDNGKFCKFTNINVQLENGLLDFKKCFDARIRDINKSNKNLEDDDDDHDSR